MKVDATILMSLEVLPNNQQPANTLDIQKILQDHFVRREGGHEFTFNGAVIKYQSVNVIKVDNA